ncbi:MAG TPA: succinate-semialdehyde dehydrogenase, partial [Erythrobacter sp.]|nr:succinate-semialdehyde dehydrogenase [Erythrobacter sp.]
MSQIQTRNPATGEVLETYEVMSEQEVFAKIDNAHEAFLDWRSKSHEERAPYLRKIAGVLRDNSERFSELMTREMGKLLRDGKTEVELCARLFEYAADKGPEELADQERTHSGGKKRGIVTFSPIGVIYSVQPWNFPLYQPVRVLAANLIAGNSVILKHASICTGSGLLLRDLCEEAGLPKGLFDVIIVGHDLSDKVIEHKLIRAVTMTGSDGAGSHI